MKITKYEHACLDIQVGQQRLIIDPGEYTESLKDFSNVDVVVITHVHADHYDKEKLLKIIELNPSVLLYSTDEVAQQLKEFEIIIAVNGNSVKAGEFNLKFYGVDHAEIDPQSPVAKNFGVLVNDVIYYPGDSFNLCHDPFKILAVPASGPWLRVGQTIPLIEDSACKLVFATHDALLSEIGHNSTNNWLERFAKRSGKEFKYLRTGESIKI